MSTSEVNAITLISFSLQTIEARHQGEVVTDIYYCPGTSEAFSFHLLLNNHLRGSLVKILLPEILYRSPLFMKKKSHCNAELGTKRIINYVLI